MSDYLRNVNIQDRIADEGESKLSLVIRKPQEGKTFICITRIIKDQSKNIHIVLTMNTLAAGMQFFGRMEEDIGSNHIVVFNSNKKTAGNCWHAKSIYEVIEHIANKDIKVVVCCAHTKRFRDCLPHLFIAASQSIPIMQSNIKFELHIDEAHKYIPENVDQIREFNKSSLVINIIGYSASPKRIWSRDSSDELFHKILIRDVEAELDIIRSPNYFGVNRCIFNVVDDISHAELLTNHGISAEIPEFIYARAHMTCVRKIWYESNSIFDLGNEMLLFAFLNYILPSLQLAPDAFSYVFAPAYTRKATHYQNAEIILKHYPTANVIVSNGDNSAALYRYREQTQRGHLIKTDEMIKQSAKAIPNEEARKAELQRLLEPSYMIQQLIKDTPDCPTFVTGFTCVGMSVTLINQEIGNFDHVIMAHDHYSKDKLYQLCRFLFNYTSWTQENIAKIKTTKFHSLTQAVVNTCLEYEEDTEKMSTDFAGKTCSSREIQGLEPEEPTERELKKAAMQSIKITNPNGKFIKKFKVYDDNDAEIWAAVDAFYQNHMGKPLTGKSRPSQNELGYWECSTTSHVGTHTTAAVDKMEKQSWYSTLLLQQDCLHYARVFVGYEKLDDPTEYTIYVKWVKLEDNENTRNVLQKYGKK